MSQENVEIVRRSFKAFTVNDFETLFAGLSPSIVIYSNPEEPEGVRRYEGWDGLMEYLTNWFSGWEDYKVEPNRFLESGDYVVVDAREEGTATHSGIKVEQSYSHAMKLEDGLVIEWRMFNDVNQALEAAGLVDRRR